MKALYSLLLSFSLALGVASAAETSRLDEILARGVLRVGTTGDYKPFSYRDPANGDFVGLDIELAQSLAKSLGVKLELVPTSWPALMKDFGAGRFDIGMSGISVTLERQQRAFFSQPYQRDGKTPIARCTDASRFQTLQQIDQPGVRVVFNPGGTNERFAREHLRQAQLIVFPDNTRVFDEIVAGRADLMMTDAIETRLQARLHPELCAIHPDAPFDFSEKAYLLPRDTVFKAYVDQWLHLAIASGAFDKSLDSWLSYRWPGAVPAPATLAELGRLIDRRLALSVDVARYKWNTGGKIEDATREAQVIDDLKAQAVALGLPADWAARFFRAQIEASKIVQRDLFIRWDKEGAGHFTEVPDLVRAIRPQLDALTPQILRALKENWTRIAAGESVAEGIGTLPSAGVNAGAVNAALAPLLDGSAAQNR
jgi:chorismate mutase-like protein